MIEGWDKGLVGIRKGGRRMLTIPPELAYGPEGSPPTIGPNETLVFVIDARRHQLAREAERVGHRGRRRRSATPA